MTVDGGRKLPTSAAPHGFTLVWTDGCCHFFDK